MVLSFLEDVLLPRLVAGHGLVPLQRLGLLEVVGDLRHLEQHRLQGGRHAGAVSGISTTRLHTLLDFVLVLLFILLVFIVFIVFILIFLVLIFFLFNLLVLAFLIAIFVHFILIRILLT